jgi:hypothetical protein
MLRNAVVFMLLLVSASSARATLVTGHVTDAQTLAPISGASVSYFNVFGPFGGTTTDNAGFYSLDIPQGTPFFYVSADGYVTYSDDIRVEVTPLTMNVALTEAGTIKGTVRDAGTLQPLPGERIFLIHSDQPELSSDAATTDETGAYELDGLAPGTYGVCVKDADDNYRDACYDTLVIGADGVAHYTEIDVAPGSVTQNIDLALVPGATLSGTFTDRYFGTPIASQEMEVLLYSGDQRLLSDIRLTTDASGVYAISGLAPGDYFLGAGEEFDRGNTNGAYTRRLYGGGDCGQGPNEWVDCTFDGIAPITVPTSGVGNIDLALFPGYVMTGRVVDAVTGNGLVGVSVHVCEVDGIVAVSGAAVTDVNGYYAVGHAVNEHTSLIASPGASYLTELWPNLALASDACVIAPTVNEIKFTQSEQVLANLDFHIAQESAVNGTILSGELTPEPLSASVAILSYPSGAVLASGHSDANGAFQIVGSFAGPIAVIAYLDGGQDCRVFDWDFCGFDWSPFNLDKADLSIAITFTLNPGETAGPLMFYLGDDVFTSNFE